MFIETRKSFATKKKSFSIWKRVIMFHLILLASVIKKPESKSTKVPNGRSGIKTLCLAQAQALDLIHFYRCIF